MTCRCGGQLVEERHARRGWRVTVCDRCGTKGLPYSLRSRAATLRRRERMQRDAERILEGQRPPRPQSYQSQRRTPWTPDLAVPVGQRG